MNRLFFVILIVLSCNANEISLENTKSADLLNQERLSVERKNYEKILKSLTKKNLIIITKEKIFFEKNRGPFNPDYRTSKLDKNSDNYQYYPYYKFKISKDIYHIAFSCISSNREKSYFVVIKEYEKNYSLIYIKEYPQKEFFIDSYLENGKRYVHLQFENDTDYADLYSWNGKTYIKEKLIDE
ncbi:MAG TPA: hypothetical protein P5270_08760 [Victivallales bacterium]|nr:hypothetical protein [Victivallales bacterium]